MDANVNWEKKVSEKFPELAICIGTIKDIFVEKEDQQIQSLRKTAYEKVRAKYGIEMLKDNKTVRAYRDFYWKLDIDPTKTRPSGEALLRRVLHGNELPHISTVVDAYNLASMETIIPISGFDKDRVNPPFHIRFAKNNEAFTGIGMDKPMLLTDNMLVLSDEKQILCIYPYRDSDHTKITGETKNALIVGYGALKIGEQALREAVDTTLSYIKLVAGGEIETIKVLSLSRK